MQSVETIIKNLVSQLKAYKGGNNDLSAIEHAEAYLAAQFTQPPYGREAWVKVPVDERNPVFDIKGVKSFHTNMGKLLYNNIDNEWVSDDKNQDVQYPAFWLERTTIPQPVSAPPDFLEFVKDERLKFCKAIIDQEWNTELRTAAESFVIAYNQMMDRIGI